MQRRSLSEARAALPAPDEAGAFVFEGAPEDGGDGPVRSLRIAVEPGEYRGEPAWFVLQEVDEKAGPRDPFVLRRTTAWFSADLRILAATTDPPPAGGHDPQGDATRTLAGALIFLRECPAEVAAYVREKPYDQPGEGVAISRVEPDGTIHAAAPTVDAYHVDVMLRGPDRDVAEVRRSLGRHAMGRLVAGRPSAK